MKLRFSKLLACAVPLAAGAVGISAGVTIDGQAGLIAALLVLFFGGACLLFWVVIVERFLVPMTEGMREAELEYRARRGHCLACGYDLRATRGKCPECGAAAEQGAAK